MKTPVVAALCLPFLLLFGCAKTDTENNATDSGDSGMNLGDGPGPTYGNGTLGVRFAIDDDVAESMDLPPAGMFIGEVYNAEDVTGLGPNDGAVPLTDFTVDLDLAIDGTPSDVVYTTPIFDVIEVTVLGTLDVDGSGNASGGDPITLPHQTSFDVLEGTSEVVVEFNMLYPGG
jgi:hypothetical protein